MLFSPLEVVKTRLQLQAAPGWTKIHSGGLFAALRAILAQDGVLLSWSHGLAPGVARDFVYSGFRTGMYPTVRNAIGGEDARFVRVDDSAEPSAAFARREKAVAIGRWIVHECALVECSCRLDSTHLELRVVPGAARACRR